MGQEALIIHVREMDQFPGAVYIGRKNSRNRLPASQWANPYIIGEHGSRDDVLYMYQQMIQGWLIAAPAVTRMQLAKIAGRPLACWCRYSYQAQHESNRCHGDILLEAIQREGIYGNG